MRKQKGFTLIELLVVIAIIGLLSTLAAVALGNAKQKSRDAKRLSDIKQVQTAMELYYQDAGSYPASLGTSIANGSTTFMAVVPTNPTPNGATYTYTQTESGASYTLTYSLEGTSGGVASGAHTATPAGIANP